MFVSVILDSEYMGMGERIKWFLKNLSYSKTNDWLIITHEYLKNNFEELLNNCSERFYQEFEMNHISKEELEQCDVCYIPDSVFEEIYKKSGKRSQMILELSYSRVGELEKHIIDAIEASLIKRNETRVEGIFNCLHCFKSIEYIADLYECPVIPYVFSAIRKVHGYRQTLYMANMSYGLMNNSDIEKMYEDFRPEELGYDLFSNEEILGLLGKERNLPLLPLVREEGEVELGIAAESFRIMPQLYYRNVVTDDDLYYEARQKYSEEDIITRAHPMQLDQIGIGRKHMQNDPVSFILKSKRVATIHSQLIIKAILWNRIPCTLSNALPFSFLLSKTLDSTERISTKDLNFIIFCYLIPDCYMFDVEYWRWREKKPSTNLIYEKHLQCLLQQEGYCWELIFDKNRFVKILYNRGCEDSLINNIIESRVKDKVDYSYLISKIMIHYCNGIQKTFYCMNYIKEKGILSEYKLEETNLIERICFYPLDGVDGWLKINYINDRKVEEPLNRYVYCPKNYSGIEIIIEKELFLTKSLKIYWNALDVEEYLKRN